MAANTEKAWELVQIKTFTKWTNSHLVKSKYTPISNISEDWHDGIKLMELVNALYQVPLPKKINRAAKMKPQKLDNIEQALDMLTAQAKVKTNFLKPGHLVDHDTKMLLGMVWAIILHFQINGISVEEMSAKEGLLLWFKKKTAGYKDVNVQNFTNSWTDGLAFCALIHRHRPDLINFDSLSKANGKDNLNLAFDVAEKHLGIAKLLDAEDLYNVARPDERSIITYVSEFFHKFSAQDQIEVAGKRIANLVAIAKANEQLKADYQLKGQALIDWINQQIAAEQDRTYDNTLAGVESKWDDHKSYLKNVKPGKTREKLDVEAQLNQLQAKLRLNNRPAYEPPAHLTNEAIESLWQKLSVEESARDEWIRKEWERQSLLEQMYSRFWRKATAILAWGSDSEKLLSSADLGDSVAAVQAKLKNQEGFEENTKQTDSRLQATKVIGQQLIDQQHGKSAEVSAKISELDAMFVSVTALSAKRRSALEQELARQQTLDQMRLQFATRGRAFSTWIEDAEVGELAEPNKTNSLENLAKLEHQFTAFEQDCQQQAGELASLQQYSNEMSQAGITTNAYAAFTIQQLADKWAGLQTEMQSRKQSLASERTRLQENDQLCKEFAAKAQAFHDLCVRLAQDIEATADGDLAKQLEQIKVKEQNVANQKSLLQELESFDAKITERNISYNPHTKFTTNGLTLTYENVVERGEKRRNLIEKEILNQAGSGVSEEQVAEFRETFKAFDKNGNGILEKHEFKACLSALGHDMSDSALDQVMAQIGKKNPPHIVFEEFVAYIQKSDSSDSPNTVKNAFKAVAGDKDYVTAEDLKKIPGLDPATLAYLLANLPKDGDKLNFDQYVNSQYFNANKE